MTDRQAAEARATEYRVEDDSGFLLDRVTGDVTAWEGIRIRWRFIGERKWCKRVLIPDEGQTRASLKRDAAEIVDALARKEAAASGGREAPDTKEPAGG